MAADAQVHLVGHADEVGGGKGNRAAPYSLTNLVDRKKSERQGIHMQFFQATDAISASRDEVPTRKPELPINA